VRVRVCFVVPAAPVSVTTAKTEQTDQQIVKTVRSSESHGEQLTLTTVTQSRIADVKTSSRDRAAALTSSDLRSNSQLLVFYFVVIITLLYKLTVM